MAVAFWPAVWGRRGKEHAQRPVPGPDPDWFSIDLLVRTEAIYVCSSSQDVRGSWWANDAVTRLNVPVGVQELADALATAREATRRDLPAPASWSESPDNPRPAVLVKLSGAKSPTAFFRGTEGMTVDYRRGTVTITRLKSVPGGHVGVKDSEVAAPTDDDSTVALEAMKILATHWGPEWVRV